MGWFSNLKIRNKLLIVFGAFLGAMVFFTVFASVKISIIGNDINELFDSIQARQIYIADAKEDVYKMRLTTISHGYLADDDAYIDSFRALQEQYVSDAESLKNNLKCFRECLSGDPRLLDMERQELLALEGIEKTLEHYISLASGVRHATEKKDKAEVVRLYEEAVPVGNQLTGRVKDLSDQLFYTTRARAIEISQSAEGTVSTITAMTNVLIVVTILILLFTIRNITRPIRQLRTVAVDIAGGNLACPVRNDRKDELGELSNSICDMVEKLTEREQLKDALETARIASEAKSSFLANMSHEIRTPMNAILGITEIQLQNEKITPDVAEAFSKIYNSGDMLLGIINDILDLSKIEAKKLELVLSEYTVASLINDCATLNMMRIGSKPIKFELSVDGNIPSTFMGDEIRIKQILNNIISNAIKYTDEGLVHLSVASESWTGSKDSDVNLIFTVIDTGRGMTEEQVDKLFDEYTRFDLKANRTTEGTGLGMNITKNLIDLMYGTIDVQSKPGRGSVFTVKIPQKRVGRGILGGELAKNLNGFNMGSKALVRGKQLVREPMPYGKVLVVDDVETNLYVAKGLLSPYELSIDTALSGREAIDKIESGKLYDIVFMDHMMPGMDGIETVKILREQGYSEPIVALTANAVSGQAEVFLANGFDDFISKPIDVRQLHASLKKYVKPKKPPGLVIDLKPQTEDKDISEKEGSPGIDKGLADAFVRDAAKTISELERINKISGSYSDEDLKIFTTQAHAMKSALANVGEQKLSALAKELEHAGREKDFKIIRSKIMSLITGIRDVCEKLSQKKEGNEGGTGEMVKGSNEYLFENLYLVYEACGMFDQSGAKRAAMALKEKSWSPAITTKLNEISGYILGGDFERAAAEADEVMDVVWEDGDYHEKTS